MNGYCDIFARAANIKFKYPMYAIFEYRTLTIKGKQITRRGLIHAFLCVKKHEQFKLWDVLDADGFTKAHILMAENDLDETMWVEKVTQKELKAIAYTKPGILQGEYDKLLMKYAKQYIRHSLKHAKHSTTYNTNETNVSFVNF